MNAVRVAAGVANNVIPDEALLTVNYRYAPTTSPAEAEAQLRALFSDFEVAVVDNAGGALPGLDRIGDLVALCDGKVAPKFGWTDVARFSAMGIPAVNLGPGDPSLAHARNEHVPISQVYRCREVLTAWLTGDQHD
jgi:succinyl-diaminopimelate desuccinylase